MNARLVVLVGSANPALGCAIAAGVDAEAVPATVERFPDGEVGVTVGEVRGADVFVVQPTSPPVDDHVVELLMLADACRRGGAGRTTAVVPYFGYARQDRRRARGEAVGAKVIADLLSACVDRLVLVDPHTPGLEALCSVPVEQVSAVPRVAAALRAGLPTRGVVVAPDLGAVKLAERYADALDLPVAFVRKTRLSGERVRAEEVVGDVADRVPIVVDDMITTAGTVEAAIQAVRTAGATDETVVAATHGVFVGAAMTRLAGLAPRRVVVTDTIAPPAGSHSEIVTIAPTLAEVIARLHHDEPMGDLVAFR